jgi:hypothetical protein
VVVALLVEPSDSLRLRVGGLAKRGVHRLFEARKRLDHRWVQQRMDLSCEHPDDSCGHVDPVEGVRRSSGSRLRTADGLQPIPIELPIPDAEMVSGGGGLFGTVGDYVRFLRVLLGRGGVAVGKNVVLSICSGPSTCSRR